MKPGINQRITLPNMEKEVPDNSLQTNTMPERIKKYMARAIAVGVAVSTLVFGTMVIHQRSAMKPAVQSMPIIAVNTMIAKLERQYKRVDYYAGLIEPKRTVQLAFERSGSVLEIRADEGDNVEKGDTIAVLDKRHLIAQQDELKARRATLLIQVELADITAARSQNLNSKGWTAKQAYDEKRLDLARLQASVKELDAALLGISIDLDKSVLIAPFSGIVTRRRVDDGAIVSPGTALLDIIEASHPQIRIGIPQSKAQTLVLNRDYMVDLGTLIVSAKLNALRPDIDPITRAIIAIFDLPADGNYQFGSLANIVLETIEEQQGIWLPLTSLREIERDLWSVATVKNGRSGLETVEILAIDGQRAFVRGTLVDGAHVIENGTHRLEPGTPVEVAG